MEAERNALAHVLSLVSRVPGSRTALLAAVAPENDSANPFNSFHPTMPFSNGLERSFGTLKGWSPKTGLRLIFRQQMHAQPLGPRQSVRKEAVGGQFAIDDGASGYQVAPGSCAATFA